jgi:hypothetical protein
VCEPDVFYPKKKKDGRKKGSKKSIEMGLLKIVTGFAVGH